MASMDDINMTGEIELPGFRFHPTEQELLDFYLKNMVFGKKLRFDIIGFLNIYHHEPWDLPGMAKVGEREWYFFVPRDKKHGTGGRPNRTTEKGFWKATGSDRKIFSLSGPKSIMGLRKTLVFYEGRAPRGRKTDWVMNEYRLPDTPTCSLPKPKDIVLCKIYRKATSLKVLEQRAAIEEEMKQLGGCPSSPLSSTVTMSICSQQEEQTAPLPLLQHVVLKKEIEEMTSVSVSVSVSQKENSSRSQMAMPIKDNKTTCSTSLQLPFGRDKLPELQMPMMTTDWTQDSFWAQLNSPWQQNLVSYSNILNF